MKKNILFILTVLMIVNLSYSQKNSLEFSSFGLSYVPYSLNRITKISPSFGLNYVRSIHPKIAMVAGGTYLNNIFKDDCNRCADHFSGFLDYRQITCFLGARYFLRKKLIKRFNYFAELNATYLNIKAVGDYQGGLGGQGAYTNLISTGWGGDAKLGMLINISKRLHLSINGQLLLGRSLVTTYKPYYPGNYLTKRKESLWKEGIELRIGYKF